MNQSNCLKLNAGPPSRVLASLPRFRLPLPRAQEKATVDLSFRAPCPSQELRVLFDALQRAGACYRTAFKARRIVAGHGMPPSACFISSFDKNWLRTHRVSFVRNGAYATCLSMLEAFLATRLRSPLKKTPNFYRCLL